jgi:hypothetical protein
MKLCALARVVARTCRCSFSCKFPWVHVAQSALVGWRMRHVLHFSMSTGEAVVAVSG